MTGTVFSNRNQADLIKSLVQSLKREGVSIPERLSDEIKLLDSARIIKAKQDAHRVSALNDLEQVPADQFENALIKAQSLWATSDPVAEFSGRVEAIHFQRVASALYAASGGLMADLEGKINDVVADSRLNEVSLPPDLATFDFMRSTVEDQNAIMTFRQAAPKLNTLWSHFKSIGKHLGHDLSGRETSSALDLVFMLTDVDNFYDAQVLAQGIGMVGQGLTSMQNIDQLGVWGVINVSGHRIEVRSINEAEFRRQEVQFPTAQEKVVSNRAAGFVLE